MGNQRDTEVSRPTPEELLENHTRAISSWQRKKAIQKAERAVIEATEGWYLAQQNALDDDAEWQALYDAISKLREARGE